MSKLNQTTGGLVVSEVIETFTRGHHTFTIKFEDKTVWHKIQASTCNPKVGDVFKFVMETTAQTLYNHFRDSKRLQQFAKRN